MSILRLWTLVLLAACGGAQKAPAKASPQPVAGRLDPRLTEPRITDPGAEDCPPEIDCMPSQDPRYSNRQCTDPSFAERCPHTIRTE